jgi:hypothetical protein
LRVRVSGKKMQPPHHEDLHLILSNLVPTPQPLPRQQSASIAHSTSTFHSSTFQPRLRLLLCPSCSVSAFLHTQGHYLGLPFLGQALTSCPYAPSAAPYDRGLQKHFELDLPPSLLSPSDSHHEASSILRLYLVHPRRKLGSAMQSRLYVEL